MDTSNLIPALTLILTGLAGLVLLLRFSEAESSDELKRARRRLTNVTAAVQKTRHAEGDRTANVRAAIEAIAHCTRILRNTANESQAAAALAAIEKSAGVLSLVVGSSRKGRKAGVLAQRQPLYR
ncbi:MAG TPA: hypothetical protein VGF48_00545 [Thermoanaerobaculia bacterium]|jgi:hypothetical protein